MDLKQIHSELAHTEQLPPTGTSFLIQGESGSGKTKILETAPSPVFVDSFDPRGTETILEAISAGKVFADTRWERDDPKIATTFDSWATAFANRQRMGFFDAIGTYAIDSATGMLTCIMNKVLKKEGRAGGTPQQNDWLPQMTVFQNVMNVVAALPCNVIVTFHLDMKEDAMSGQLIMRPLVTGKLVVRVPLLFSEIYVLESKPTSKGIEYSVLTQSTGRYMARTRMGRDGRLSVREEPNIKALLQKAGRQWEDKVIQPLEEQNG